MKTKERWAMFGVYAILVAIALMIRFQGELEAMSGYYGG